MPRAPRTCSICDRPHRRNGLCAFHSGRRRDGTALDAPYQPHAVKDTPVYDKVMAMSAWEGNCFIFTRSVDEDGYGRVRTSDGRTMRAHRVVMEHHHGPSELHVLHSCDNPPCVNIAHLRYGTDADNSEDSKARGRRPAVGERAEGTGRWKGRLSDEDVAAIRADPRGSIAIAADYGVIPRYIRLIKAGERRRHVDPSN